jgi:hypothetical protein
MTKLTNYLVTVTDVKETLTVSAGQSAPANSDRITISEDSGGFSFGTVGVTPTFCLADSSPILTNPDGKCPVYQDLIPRTIFSGFVNTFLISATGNISSPSINCTYSEFSYVISLAASAGATTGTTTLTAQVTSNVTLKGTSVRLVYYGSSLAVAGVDYNVIAYNGNPAPFSIGYLQIELLKPIISGTPYNVIFNAQFNALYGTFSLSEAVYGNDGCYGPFINNQPNALVCTYVAPTTTTSTTTLASRNVTLDPRNSLAGSSYTVYINGTADTGWKTGTRSYVVGTIIRIDYTSPACGVVLNSVAYSSGTNTTLSTGQASYTWTLYNANNWTNTGFVCIGNVYYTNQVNDCGGTRQIQTYPGSTCDCVCNENCNGTYNGPSVCLGSELVQYSYYNCNGNPTGSYTVISSCSCSCNQACSGTYDGSPYCVGNEQRQDYYYNCNGAYAGTNVLSACSCSCNVACNGTYWEYYCVNSGVAPYTQRRRQKYYCNNANTGVDEFVTDCSGTCGASTTPTWVNSGSYDCYGSCTKYNVEIQTNQCAPGYPNPPRQGSAVEFNSSFCGGCCGASPSANWVNNGSTFCSGCYLQQPQIDDNVCSSTYGQTRDVDLGVNTACGVWVQSFYCVGYDKWSKETNSCTGNIQNQYLVEVNSPYCGYVPPPTCRTYQIIGYNSDEYVDGVYTNCGGGSDSFSFYGGPGTVGYICAQISSVYITSGNGAANDVGGC